MMNETSERLGLPLIAAGQAQKEMTHNEALALLDLAVQAGVETVGMDAPPADPAAGAAWIVGDAPTGSWAGEAGAIAGWSASGWRFVAPREGFAAWSIADGLEARFTGGAWRLGEVSARTVRIEGVQVLGARASAITDPEGGATIDSEARAAIGAVLAALRAHGLISTS